MSVPNIYVSTVSKIKTNSITREMLQNGIIDNSALAVNAVRASSLSIDLAEQVGYARHLLFSSDRDDGEIKETIGGHWGINTQTGGGAGIPVNSQDQLNFVPFGASAWNDPSFVLTPDIQTIAIREPGKYLIELNTTILGGLGAADSNVRFFPVFTGGDNTGTVLWSIYIPVGGLLGGLAGIGASFSLVRRLVANATFRMTVGALTAGTTPIMGTRFITIVKL